MGYQALRVSTDGAVVLTSFPCLFQKQSTPIPLGFEGFPLPSTEQP